MLPKVKDLRIFAFIWAAIFMIIGIYPIVHNNGIKMWAVEIAVIIVAIGVIKPTFLSKIYLLWIKLGEFIGNIVSHIIMLVLYLCLFTPVSIILKLLGKDLLNKKIDKSKSSYWIKREVQPQSMKNQF